MVLTCTKERNIRRIAYACTEELKQIVFLGSCPQGSLTIIGMSLIPRIPGDIRLTIELSTPTDIIIIVGIAHAIKRLQARVIAFFPLVRIHATTATILILILVASPSIFSC